MTLICLPSRRTVSAFSPLSLSPSLWLDERGMEINGAGAGIGDQVSLWGDQSGNGNHLRHDNPQLFGIKVEGGLLLDNVDDGYVSDLNIVRPFHIFVVEKPTSFSSTYMRTIQSMDVNALLSAARQQANTAYLDGNVSDYAVTNLSTCLLELSASTQSTTTYRVNGVDRAVGSPSSANWGRFALGAQGIFAEPGNTTIKEILIFPRILTIEEKRRLNDYFAEKHAINVS